MKLTNTSTRRNTGAAVMSPSSISPRSVAVILPAAGSGQRFGQEQNKLFAWLAEKPLWVHAAETLSRLDEVGVVLLAVAASDRETFEQQMSFLTFPERFKIVIGGAQRSDSVAAAIDTLATPNSQSNSPQIQWVAVHDAARPLLRTEDVVAVFEAAAESHAAILAAPVIGTLKRQRSGSENSADCQTFDRRGMWQALTPQVFHLDLIRRAYAHHRGRAATDDAELVERIGHPVRLVQGSADNLKVTYPEDLRLAEALLRTATKNQPPNPLSN